MCFASVLRAATVVRDSFTTTDMTFTASYITAGFWLKAAVIGLTNTGSDIGSSLSVLANNRH
jgi:hypothetical protein